MIRHDQHAQNFRTMVMLGCALSSLDVMGVRACRPGRIS